VVCGDLSALAAAAGAAGVAVVGLVGARIFFLIKSYREDINYIQPLQ
jgi:hypothetical protein